MGKQKLVAFARHLRLLPLLEVGRFSAIALGTRRANAKFCAEYPGFRPPPLALMHDMYAHTSYAQYVESGRIHAEEIRRRVQQYAPGDPKVAEWGCGLGRVLRHLPFRRTGFDYNHDAIRWCRANLKGIDFRANELMPPLPAEEGEFEVLYCISVFTHLSEKAHMAWIDEIVRVLKPGGLLIATFHGPEQSDVLLPHEKAEFASGKLVTRSKVKEGSRTFTAYHPVGFVRRLLEHFEILEGPVAACGQTMWIGRKGTGRLAD